MTTLPEITDHHACAVGLLREAIDQLPEEAALTLQYAQVHATLAERGDRESAERWRKAYVRTLGELDELRTAVRELLDHAGQGPDAKYMVVPKILLDELTERVR